MPNLKGKVSNIHKVNPPALFEVTYELCNKPVIANTPVLPVTENNLLKNIIIPLIINTLENTIFTLSKDYIKDCFKYMSNLNEKGKDYMKFYINIIDN